MNLKLRYYIYLIKVYVLDPELIVSGFVSSYEVFARSFVGRLWGGALPRGGTLSPT